MTAKNNIQKNLIFLANSPGFSRAVLAKEIGVSKKVLASYIEGRSSPKLQTLIIIADKFALSLDALIRSEISSRHRFQVDLVITKLANESV